MVDKTPFKIGSGPDCDWRIDDFSVAEEHCVIQRKGRAFCLLASNGTDAVLLDGVANPGGELASDVDHTLVIGGHFFALHGSSDAQKWLRGMNHSEWFIYDKAEQRKFGPLAFSILANALEHRPDRGEHAIILCRGLTSMGFYAEQVLPFLPRSAPSASSPAAPSRNEPEPTQIDIEYGIFSASTPEDAFLAKTELEGAMSETLPRLGRKVPLSKSFIFHSSEGETKPGAVARFG